MVFLCGTCDYTWFIGIQLEHHTETKHALLPRRGTRRKKQALVRERIS
jgi:hypothetical protein